MSVKDRVKKLIESGKEDPDSYERLLQEKKSFTCWNCGKRHKPGTSWCDKCGSDICDGMTRDEKRLNAQPAKQT